MRRRIRTFIAACAGACCLVSGEAGLCQTTPPTESAVQGVQAAAQQYQAALARGDGERLRQFWTREGMYVDAAGNSHRMQETLTTLAAADQAPQAGAAARPTASRFKLVTPDVVIEDGATGPYAQSDGSQMTVRYTAVWVKQNGRWLLDSLRDAPVVASAGHPQLQALKWLVGEWTGAAGDASMLLSWKWAEGGHFLVGEYAVYRDDAIVAGGTQRLGWDPVAKTIRSWLFDSQGGMGEGRWQAEGGRWTVESTHVTAEGAKSRSRATYILQGTDAFAREATSQWEAVQPPTADAKLPAERIEFRRAPVNP